MRWILFSLILFNLLYFAWQFYLVPRHELPRSTSADISTTPLPGDRLVLVKEALDAGSPAAPPVSIDPKVRERQVRVAPVEIGPADSGNPVPNEPADKPLLQAEAELLPDREAPPVEVAEPEAVAPGVRDEVVVDEPALSRVCVRVGPFADRVSAESLVANIEAKGFSPVIRQDEVVVDIDNWVIIPPLPDRPEALRMLRRLQGSKIDSYLITEGEFVNGISLGLFKQADSAQAVLAKMLSAGYDAEIRQIRRTQARFWVGLTGEFEPASIEPMLTQLVDDTEKINFSETLCEMFASTP